MKKSHEIEREKGAVYGSVLRGNWSKKIRSKKKYLQLFNKDLEMSLEAMNLTVSDLICLICLCSAYASSLEPHLFICSSTHFYRKVSELNHSQFRSLCHPVTKDDMYGLSLAEGQVGKIISVTSPTKHVQGKNHSLISLCRELGFSSLSILEWYIMLNILDPPDGPVQEMSDI